MPRIFCTANVRLANVDRSPFNRYTSLTGIRKGNVVLLLISRQTENGNPFALREIDQEISHVRSTSIYINSASNATSSCTIYRRKIKNTHTHTHTILFLVTVARVATYFYGDYFAKRIIARNHRSRNTHSEIRIRRRCAAGRISPVLSRGTNHSVSSLLPRLHREPPPLATGFVSIPDIPR